MLSRDYKFPFFDNFVRSYGVDAFFETFFDANNNLLPSAPQELCDEVAAMRGDEVLLERYKVEPEEATA